MSTAHATLQAMDRGATKEAAEVLGALLDAVDRGELTAESESARRLLHRLEGAHAVLDAEEVVRDG